MIYASKASKGFFHTDVHQSLPPDAVEIAEVTYAALLNAQSSGKVIDWSGTTPVAIDPPQPSASDVIKKQITSLEVTATPRRLREAVLGIDGGWLKNVDDQIAALRAKLT